MSHPRKIDASLGFSSMHREELNNVVAVHGAKPQLHSTASADLPNGTWYYVPKDGGWIHSSQVR